MRPAYHNFDEDNAASLEWEQEPWLRRALGQIFPDLKYVEPERAAKAQKNGVDVWLVRDQCRREPLDFKFRRRFATAKPDVALEIYADEKRKKLGWAMLDDVWTQWVGYVFLPSMAVWTLAFDKLRSVLDDHLQEWIELANEEREGFSWKGSHNRSRWGDYLSRNLIVPMVTLDDLGVVYDLRVCGRLSSDWRWARAGSTKTSAWAGVVGRAVQGGAQ